MPRGEPTDRPQYTCALADLAWSFARATRGALHPAWLAEASLHRHRAVSAVAASKRRNQRFLVPWRAATARFAPWRTSQPPTDHALRTADLAWLSLRPTRCVLHRAPLAGAPLQGHRARSAAAASKRRKQSLLAPWRAARSRLSPWRTSRPPTDHAMRTADLAWLFSRPTRGALHPTTLAEAPLHRHRARLAAAASHRRSRAVIASWRAARAR